MMNKFAERVLEVVRLPHLISNIRINLLMFSNCSMGSLCEVQLPKNLRHYCISSNLFSTEDMGQDEILTYR